MKTNAVYRTARGLQSAGLAVLRFNFRGVGRSQGTFDRGEGELSDAASALDWLQDFNEGASACWIAGFSFGAWIGMQLLMRRPEISAFISIAPPANLYDFTFLAPCPSSGMIIQGVEDEIVPPASVQKLVEKLKAQRNLEIDYRLIPGANHFFHDNLEQLDQHLSDYLSKKVPVPDQAAIAQ